jgi:hypothetical protein
LLVIRVKQMKSSIIISDLFIYFKNGKKLNFTVVRR